MQARSRGSEFLIRAAQNRQTTSAQDDPNLAPLFTTVEQGACQGTFSLALQRTPRRAARTALVSVRFTQLWLHPPEHLGHLAPIAVTALLAEEVQPPVQKEPPLRWLLLTTLAVPDLAMARQCLKWYSFRWAIERYHLALKSGCRLEALQLKLLGSTGAGIGLLRDCGVAADVVGLRGSRSARCDGHRCVGNG